MKSSWTTLFCKQLALLQRPLRKMHMNFGLSTKFVCEVHVSADRERDGPGSISRVTGRVDSAVAVGKGHVEKRGRGWFRSVPRRGSADRTN